MGAEIPNPDLLLARRAGAGQPAAWDELVARYGRRIYNLAFQFAGDRGEGEDLAQEIFLKLYLSLPRYRGDVPLVAWALRLSRNLCIDYYRRSRRLDRAELVSEEILAHHPADDDPRADLQYRQRLRRVYRALQEMSEELAMTVLLRDLQGLSYDEVAAALEVPVGTVKSRLNRGRQELTRRVRDRLEQPGGQASVHPYPPQRGKEAQS